MAHDPLIGAQLGNYTIEKVLGQGGMGVVYLALDSTLDRRVALKVLAPNFADDEAFKDRFARESRLAASLDHPNVVPIFEASEADGRLYIAMRNVTGTDLKKLIQGEGGMDPGRVVSIIGQVAGALDEAHSAGLIHRDVKPANILITRHGESGRTEHAYLTDFGVTKRSGSMGGLTKTGTFVGTIDYIAPEQIEGKPVDHRTDVYSLGCVTYEALVGETPFVKDTDVAVMYGHLMEDRPSIRTSRPELSAALDDVVKRGMAREADDRYPSAGAFAEALEDALAGREAATLPVAPKPKLRATKPKAAKPEAPPKAEAPAKAAGPRMPMRFVLPVVGVAALAALLFFLTRGGEGSGGSEGAPSDAVFVSASGDDGAEGTQGEPVASLQRAVELAGDGGTVVVADGTYNVAASEEPAVFVDHAITIEAEEGATPVFRGDGDEGVGIHIAPDTSDVTIRGLTFEDLEFPLGVECEPCDEQVQNRNLVFEDLTLTGNTYGIAVGSGEDVRVTGVHVTDTVDSGFLCNPGPCNGLEITDSTFEGSTGAEADGIQVVLSDGVVIEDTVVRDNGNDGMDIDARFTSIARTVASDNGDNGLRLWPSNATIMDSLFTGNGAEGIIACPGGCDPGTFRAGNILVMGNGGSLGTDGMSIAGDEASTPSFELFNSILTDNQGVPLVLGPEVNVDRLDFNLFYTSSDRDPSIRWGNKVFDGLDLGHSRFPGDVDAGTYWSRPTFVAPDDFHLTPVSVGVDGGTDVGISKTDLEGNPRVQGNAPDMGPYEQ